MSAGKNYEELVALLGRMCGIAPCYWDNFGRCWPTSTATYQNLLRAMGVPWEEPEALLQEINHRRQSLKKRLLPPVYLLPAAPETPRLLFSLWSPTADLPSPLAIAGEIIPETGPPLAWESSGNDAKPLATQPLDHGFRHRLAVNLPVPLETAYYELKLSVNGAGHRQTGATRVIVAPSRVYIPDFLSAQHRLWGLSLPLYALKSGHNWGIGDFTDLKKIMAWARTLGAAFVGINPLHPSLPLAGADPSPYSPATRLFINFLYLDLEAVPELPHCPKAQKLLASSSWQNTLQRLRTAPEVAYPEVYRLKIIILDLLFKTFLRLHGSPNAPHTPRGQEFAAYVHQAPPASHLYARYLTLVEVLRESDWRRWPEPYRHPDSPAVADLVQAHPEMVFFHHYVQWLAARQLEDVWQQAASVRLPFSLYQDLALGEHPGGFETWAYPHLFAHGASIGAPPDAFNPKGQNWGLPPMIPEALRNSGYRLFIDTLRANCPPGGILRLDHVMSLFRLFWIPEDQEGTPGAYVYYPARELLAILALESQRRRTLIVGEDLGTVPPRVRRDLNRLGVFSYRVFYFERDDHRQFRRPQDYPRQALAAVTTHDLPTLAGFWQGEDIQLKRRHHLYPSEETAQADEAQRPEERRQLVAALSREGLSPSPGESQVLSQANLPEEVRFGVLEFLGQSQAELLEVRLEEIFGLTFQQNLPGTTREHPNWRQKIPIPIEDLPQSPEAARLAAHLQQRRPRPPQE